MTAAPGPSLHACLQPGGAAAACRRSPGPPASTAVGRLPLDPGRRRFSFCLRLQNHTRTTSFEPQAVGQVCDLLRGGLGALEEVASEARP